MSLPPEVSEREKFDAENAFREREVKTQELEQQLKKGELDEQKRSSRWTNPLVIAILAAAIAGVSNAVVAYMGSAAQRDALNSKAEADRLLEAMKADDDKARALKLEFLKKLGLISDKGLSDKIDGYIVNVLSQKPPPSEPPPTVSACDSKIIKSLTLPSESALDGDGHKVGVVGPTQIDLSQRCDGGKPGPYQFVVSYQFYNGSGTWRGTQNATVTFHGADGGVLNPPITFAVDRSRCIYGGAQRRFADGTLSIDPKQVASAIMEISRVSGTQTPC